MALLGLIDEDRRDVQIQLCFNCQDCAELQTCYGPIQCSLSFLNNRIAVTVPLTYLSGLFPVSLCLLVLLHLTYLGPRLSERACCHIQGILYCPHASRNAWKMCNTCIVLMLSIIRRKEVIQTPAGWPLPNDVRIIKVQLYLKCVIYFPLVFV